MGVAAPSIGARAVQLVGFASLALVLAPTDYGRFVALQAIVVGCASVLGSTTSLAANAEAARSAPLTGGSARTGRRVAALILPRWRAFLVNALATAVLLPAAAGVMGVGGGGVTVALLVIGAAAGALPVTEGVLGALAGAGRVLLAAVLEACRAAVAVGGALLGGVVGGPIGAVAGTVGVEAVAIVLGGAVLLPEASRRRTGSTAVPPREGTAAGITANVLGQLANWLVLWGVSVVGGTVGLGVYGVATRFASVVTIAPVILGRAVMGQFIAPDPRRDQWTPRSYVAVLGVVSSVGALLALAVLVGLFRPVLVDYPGVVEVTVAVLAGAVLRAVLIGVGNVCVARRKWRTWVLADVCALAVVACGIGCVLSLHAGIVAIALVVAVGSTVGVVVRLLGLARSAAVGGAA